MLEYIHGRVEELTPAYAVIDVAGVGYLVNISLNTFTAMQNSETARLVMWMFFSFQAIQSLKINPMILNGSLMVKASSFSRTQIIASKMIMISNVNISFPHIYV